MAVLRGLTRPSTRTTPGQRLVPAFVWPLREGAVPPVTEEVFQQISASPDSATVADQVVEIDRLSAEFRFFHWHLEFPEVFGDPGAPEAGTEGRGRGFSCMLGNPPWM